MKVKNRYRMKINNKVRMLMVSGTLLLCQTAFAQRLAIKTNLLTDAMMIPTLGVEFSMSHRWTLSTEVEWMSTYQSHNHYLRTFSVQPEARFWFRAPFTGPFVGPSVQWRMYNMGGLPVFKLKEARTQGYLLAAGVTTGWHFTLSNRWGLEPSLTLGYGYADYKRYGAPRSRVPKRVGHLHFFGPTAASVNLVYMLR